jgi:outer membrane protein TolC
MLNFSLPGSFRIIQDFGYQVLSSVETHLSTMLKKSPIVQIKAALLNSEDNMVRAQQFSLIESISLFGEHGQEMDGRVWKVGVGIEIPIFNSRGRYVKKAKLKRERAQTELRHVRQHLLTGLKRLVAEIRIIEKEILTFKGAILKESRMNVELTEKLYSNGEVPLIVYLDSQNSHLDIQVRFFRAITEWKLLKAQLEALIGGTL